MSKKIVKYLLDLDNLPPLTEQQKAELDALKAMPDSAINYSDIPPLTDEFSKKAEVGRFYKPVKQSVTIRLDADVVAWFKSLGGKYQTALNQALRDYMAQHPKSHR